MPLSYKFTFLALWKWIWVLLNICFSSVNWHKVLSLRTVVRERVLLPIFVVLAFFAGSCIAHHFSSAYFPAQGKKQNLASSSFLWHLTSGNSVVKECLPGSSTRSPCQPALSRWRTPPAPQLSSTLPDCCSTQWAWKSNSEQF